MTTLKTLPHWFGDGFDADESGFIRIDGIEVAVNVSVLKDGKVGLSVNRGGEYVFVDMVRAECEHLGRVLLAAAEKAGGQ